ncbi:MAG: LamG domain-containing protein, partial [Streptosporangiaceae bacterium]
MSDNGLVKVYSDKRYVHTTQVRHDGTTVAFAVDTDRRIYYSILDLDQIDRAKGPLDVNYWSEDPHPLPFPVEITDPADPLARAAVVPAVKRGNNTEVVVGLVGDGDLDPFLSSTARLSTGGPIQVVSDGRYLLVFRQGIDAQAPDALFELTNGGLSGDPARTDYLLRDGGKVPVTNGSLLCDRFVLAGGRLKPVVEVRYKRSRSRLRPAAKGDTLGTRDMDGKQFFEPTQKLSFVRPVAGAGFTVLLLPTLVHGVSRWQIFTVNAATGRIDSTNLEQSREGLFDLAGTQLYTSAKPEFQSKIMQREPGTDPYTQQPLVPMPPSGDRAGTALRFDVAKGGHLGAGTWTGGTVPAGKYTLEAWIKPAAPGGAILSRGALSGAARSEPVRLELNAARNLVFVHGDSTLTSTVQVELGVYSHVAAVFDGERMRLLVNGAKAGELSSSLNPEVLRAWTIGGGLVNGDVKGTFTGEIDEVRVWNVARAGFADRFRRLTGVERGLVSYYRFDEGSGSTTADLCDGRVDGTIADGVVWVASTSPVGDGPGMVRDTFELLGRKVVGGLTAVLYYQQELAETGYETGAAPEKRNARVLLACATSGPAPAGGAADRSYLAVLDFGVAARGQLALTPGTITLSSMGVADPTVDLRLLDAAQKRVTEAQSALDALEATARKAVRTAESLNSMREELKDLYWWDWWVGAVSGRWDGRDRSGRHDLKVACEKAIPILEQQLREMIAAGGRIGSFVAEVTAAKDALATLSGGKLGGAESTVPVPVVAIDRSGLSVCGGLLAFAWSNDTPS